MNKYFIPYKNKGGCIVDWDFTNPIHCFNWHDNGQGYSETVDRTQSFRFTMHQFLMGFPIEVDHVNGNRNDNSIKNLRETTRSKNCSNRKCHRDGKLKGATKYRDKWMSHTTLNGKFKYLGLFDTEIEAHLVNKMYMLGVR